MSDARILPSPERPPIPRGTVVVRDGRILAVGEDLPIPPGVPVLSGAGRVLVAGFWNAHVHFTEPIWAGSAGQSAARLVSQLGAMFTSRGFTTVVDTGSDPRSTGPIRDRIESGEVPGPRVYTAGTPLYPPRGIPYYLDDTIPFWVRFLIPQPARPSAATRAVGRGIARGCDLVKIFTGSYVARGTVKHMPAPIARAAVETAHGHGRLVYSHPSDREGTRVAVRAGVDILAHPPDSTEGVDDSVVRSMVERGMAMTPTLKMFADTASPSAAYLDPIYDVVRRFRAAGGELLFGTDVGYLRDYSTEAEFRALDRCGLGGVDILRMLTTAPAGRFGVGAETGTVEVGRRADFVLLYADPTEDVGNFARVRATVRGGRVLYSQG